MTASVSVLIPTYNRAEFLASTLASVFGQTLPPLEVILVDDGSTDDTPAVIESLRSQHPDWGSRLRYVRQANAGKSAALNRALPLVRGQWIAFNDSDDRWMPEKLERQFQALERFPECRVSFTETTLNEFNERHPELIAEARGGIGKLEKPSRLYPVNWPGTYMQTVVVRTDAMRQCGDVDPHYRLSHDVDLLFRLGLLTPFCYVNLPLVEIHRDPQRSLGLMTTYPTRSWTAMLESESMLCKWMGLADFHSDLGKIVKRELASARSALANRYIVAGHAAEARSVLRDALRDSREGRLLAKWTLAWLMPGVLRRFAAGRAPAEFFGPEPPPASRRSATCS